MSRRWLAAPTPPSEVGEAHGRPYLLWLPDSPPPWPGMLILHGAGSQKENHADFGRLCAASGWAALAYDGRGHGEAADELSPQAIGDVGRMAALLAAREGVDERRICVRGSSMGGYVAIHAAAVSSRVAGVIAICPAHEEHLLRLLRSDEADCRLSARGRDDLEAWLGEHDIGEAVELLGERPLILVHARGDERIPFECSEGLYARAGEAKKLIVVPGGHHRSVQHDAELQAVALRWLSRSLGA